MPHIHSRWFLFPAALLVIALLPLPYGYYTFMRLVVTASAVASAAIAYRKNNAVDGWVIASAVMAIAFNPVFPVFLPRGVWMTVDLIAAAFFTLFVWRQGRIAASSTKVAERG